MLGKTGCGKSATANKLLGVELTDRDLEFAPQDYCSKLMVWGKSPDRCLYNAVGGGPHLVTKECKLMSNESSSIRVLDVPGFTDAIRTKKFIGPNFQILQWVMKNQNEYNLEFSRVMYFLPRGSPPARIDLNLQDEIECMYEAYGDVIFDNMVLIATQHDEECYQYYNDDDKARVQTFFTKAVHQITGANFTAYPPVVYLASRATPREVQEAIKSANVLKPESKMCLKFSNRCVRCAIRIESTGMRNVMNKDGEIIKYDESKCHPTFIPKYNTITRIIGGVANVALFGAFAVSAKLAGPGIWSGFTNSEEICPVCCQPPGSPGCTPVGQKVKLTSSGHMIKTDHSLKFK